MKYSDNDAIVHNENVKNFNLTMKVTPNNKNLLLQDDQNQVKENNSMKDLKKDDHSSSIPGFTQQLLIPPNIEKLARRVPEKSFTVSNSPAKRNHLRVSSPVARLRE